MPRNDFEDIFKHYYSDIYNFIYHYIMDRDDAKDLTQDVFISFFEKYKRREEVNVKYYLLSIAKNRCISFLRHRNVIDKNHLKYFETLLFSAKSEYDTTYDDLFLALNLAMNNLSELQKQIIIMKLEGKNYSEMSEHLGVTQSQIHKNIKKAYDKIRCQSKLTPDQEEIICLLFTKLLI